jgi:hypothetical protein
MGDQRKEALSWMKREKQHRHERGEEVVAEAWTRIAE